MLGVYVLQPENTNGYPVWKNTFGFYLFRFRYTRPDDQGNARWGVGPTRGSNSYFVLYPRPGSNSPLDSSLEWIFYDGVWHYDPEYFKVSVHDRSNDFMIL